MTIAESIETRVVPARRSVRPLMGRMLWHAVLVIAVVLALFPMLWAVLTSFKPANDLYSLSPIAAEPTLQHYVHVFADWPASRLIWNTFVMSAGVALGQIGIAVLAAFALVYFAPRGRGIILVLLTISLAVPPQALIIGQFLITARLGWLNSELGLIVPQLGSSALAVLILLQHVQALPPSLSQAARLDGAHPWEVLWHVVLPGLRSAIAAVGILVFITTWNDYLWPLLAAPRTEDTTVQIGLSQFQTAEGNDYGGLLAAAAITSLPIVLVYLFASRRVTDAFLHTGLR